MRISDWSSDVCSSDLISDPGTRTVFKSELYWSNLFAEASPGSGDTPARHIPVMQARLLGGGSAINGMHAQRGFARDYDEWSEYGLDRKSVVEGKRVS